MVRQLRKVISWPALVLLLYFQQKEAAGINRQLTHIHSSVMKAADVEPLVRTLRKRKSRKESIMEINFMRSGGFAGMLTQIEGKVVFDDNSAQVTSNPSGYMRKLNQQETAALRSAAEAVAKQQTSANDPGPMRDAYQYDIRVTTNDKKTYEITEHGESANPSVHSLTDWVRKECDKIWEYRTQK
jgi:hypothetical protein